jgi:hypothetical protein
VRAGLAVAAGVGTVVVLGVWGVVVHELLYNLSIDHFLDRSPPAIPGPKPSSAETRAHPYHYALSAAPLVAAGIVAALRVLATRETFGLPWRKVLVVLALLVPLNIYVYGGAAEAPPPMWWALAMMLTVMAVGVLLTRRLATARIGFVAGRTMATVAAWLMLAACVFAPALITLAWAFAVAGIALPLGWLSVCLLSAVLAFVILRPVHRYAAKNEATPSSPALSAPV